MKSNQTQLFTCVLWGKISFTKIFMLLSKWWKHEATGKKKNAVYKTEENSVSTVFLNITTPIITKPWTTGSVNKKMTFSARDHPQL